MQHGSNLSVKVSSVLSHDSYPTRIYEVLKRRISDGELALGAKLTEAHLVKEFGVSRTPLREALNRLAQEGLVTIKPYRGAFVASVSEDEVRELFEVREALEGLAARMAATRIEKQLLMELGRRLKKGIAASARDVYARYSQADREFHETVAQASGNHELIELLGSLASRIQIIRRQTVRLPSRAQRSFREHLEVIEALGRGDPDLAEARMRAHIRAVKAELVTSPSGREGVPREKTRGRH